MKVYGFCLSEIGSDEATVARLYAAATPARRARADSYRQSRDALRCLLGEALLRHALRAAGYDERVAAHPLVATGAHGKPHVVGCPSFNYNISHGGDWVVLAWDHRPVGIDVEPLDEARDVRSLAARFFTPDEQAHIAAAPTHTAACNRFYALWTAKESYLKYTGDGLSHGLAHLPPLPSDGRMATASNTIYLARVTLPDRHCLAVCGETRWNGVLLPGEL